MPERGPLKLLRQLRKAAGLTQAGMAAFFGFKGTSGRNMVARWESGEGSDPAMKHRRTFISYLAIKLGLRNDRQRFDEVWHTLEERWNWPAVTNHEWNDYVLLRSPESNLGGLGVNETRVAEKPDGVKQISSPQTTNFVVWLLDKIENKAIPDSSLPRGVAIARVGDIDLLDAPPSSTGYTEIALEHKQPTPVIESIIEEYRPEWRTEVSRLTQDGVTGRSMRIINFLEEINDVPLARITYEDMDYREGRAFHTLLERRPEIWSHYYEDALKVTRGGTRIPNIMSVHVVVVIEDRGKSKLVLAHRKGNRPGGFHHNVWAVTMGEQFSPVANIRKGREIPQDQSILQCVGRGLREELLSEYFAGQIDISIHGFFVERHLNNFGFLVFARVLSVSFENLITYWKKSPDRAEHDAIMALPFEPSLIEQCLHSESLPTEFWRQCDKAGANLEEGDHKWQPPSRIRLALALWAAQNY